MVSEMVQWTIAEAAKRLKTKAVSPVELLKAYLEAIKQLDGKLKAFITVTKELALKPARQAEKEILKGRYRSPLHGIPIALKDIINTSGVRTTAGSKILADNIPAENASVWTRLREAGSVLIGKTNMHEFARGSSTNNPHYGRCRNPWAVEETRIPGGSSGGSGAAVAACLCAGALGTDTLGSVRKPAARCGIVGIKATYDRVSRQGVIPLSWTLDHVGPMARTVWDAAAMLCHMVEPSSCRSMSPEDLLPSQSFLIKGTRIGFISGWWDARCDSEVRSAFKKALTQLTVLGCEIREIEFPFMDQIFAAGRVVAISEATTFHEPWLRDRYVEYGEDVRRALLGGFTIPARDYIHCLRVRSWAINRFKELFEKVDVIVAPCTMDPAPKIEEIKTEKGLDIAFYTGPANLVGIPAISVPCGFSSYKIPIGLQIMAPHHRDDIAINVAHAYESCTEWHHQRPPVCN